MSFPDLPIELHPGDPRLPIRILIVDDEPAVTTTLKQILERAGYECSTASNGSEALTSFASFHPALVITDVIMPGMNGIELCRRVRDSYPGCIVLLLSGNAATQELLEDASGDGHTFRVLAKPVPPRQLLSVLGELVGHEEQKRPA